MPNITICDLYSRALCCGTRTNCIVGERRLTLANKESRAAQHRCKWWTGVTHFAGGVPSPETKSSSGSLSTVLTRQIAAMPPSVTVMSIFFDCWDPDIFLFRGVAFLTRIPFFSYVDFIVRGAFVFLSEVGACYITAKEERFDLLSFLQCNSNPLSAFLIVFEI